MAKRYVAKQLVDTTRVSPSGFHIACSSGKITLMAVAPPRRPRPYWYETFGSLEELELRCAAEGIPWEDVDVSSVSGSAGRSPGE